ncbi:MAG: GtrA family protein [Alphaproteobacteria bacterium]|nr:GtrA family protein [Alphaproteobacteria bacterium]
MIKIYKYIEAIWFKHIPEKIRFLLVGGFNTVASYLLFLGFYYLFNEMYGAALVAQYLVSVNLSILTMRYYVFRSHGNLGSEYVKGLPVYIFMIIVNYPWLYIFDKIFGVSAPIAQPIFIVTSAIGTYFLLKYFSFKKNGKADAGS